LNAPNQQSPIHTHTHTRRSSSAFDDEALLTWFILQSYKCVLERRRTMSNSQPGHIGFWLLLWVNHDNGPI
jgi:hypothetical protein